MQLRYMKSALSSQEGPCKVTAIAWSPNNKRLAVVTVDRIVHLFDGATGEKKDKFSTKAAEKGDKNYVVRALQFSPDSTKLAIGQSDNIVFIYKLGLEWGDKKSICNKFAQNHSVTSVTWPSSHPNELVFGLSDGKVKVGQLRTNKPATLYSTDSYVFAVASNPDGTSVVSSHLDHSIYRFIFDDPNTGGPIHTKIAVHSCIPYALAWGDSDIVAAGNDSKVVFYDNDGGVVKSFEYEGDSSNEFTTAVFNPSGDTTVVGNFDSFYIYNYNTRHNTWAEVDVKRIENLYSVSALAWKHDGSRLAVGNICGAVDLYDACVRRYRYRNKFEFTYVSQSQVIVKRLSNNARVVIKSTFGCEIEKLNIYQDRFLVANTTSTLLVGDLDTGKISEVQWHSGGNEKYILENDCVCVVYQAGELSLIEYGQNDILGTVRTEHMSSHLLSVRINERPPPRRSDDYHDDNDNDDDNNKKVAYLLDLHTIHVKDLYTHASTTVNHDCRVDWLELNSRASLVLFRDKRRQLHIYDVDTQVRSTLLHYCNYVQWVPESDVVVAQSRSSLYVWYNIRAPDQATIYPIKGDVEEIERADGKTEVIVDEGMHTASYQLDESLIAFGTAVDDRNLSKAVTILEPLELTSETSAMWNQLSEEALRLNDHRIAERCAAALGDVSCVRYLHKLNKIASKHHDDDDARDHWLVRAKLFQLKKDFRSAEDVYLSQGRVDDVIEMYQKLHKFEDAIRVADARGHSDAESMKRSHYSYLLESRQEEKAAMLKEKEQDYTTAVNLYLKGNLPARAASLVADQASLSNNSSLLEEVSRALEDAGMHDKAGEFYERLGQEDRALDSYIKANAFRRAVELARKSFPRQVIELEESWGDYLVSQKQVDMAINHYIEANVQNKAVEAALNSRQWSRAMQLVENLDSDVGRPFYKRLARHFQDARAFDDAERCYVKGDSPQEAVEMYTSLGKWDSAHKVAVSYMSESEVSMLYISQGTRLEGQGKYSEAEKLYLTVNEPDLAINMYKKLRSYDQMIRLVGKFRKELLKETHMHLAQQLEVEGSLKDAESHYVEGGEWQAAVNMYRSSEQWDEAIRVAKYHGGINASKRVAYAWAMTLGGDDGAKLLTRLGLTEPAIDYAIESGSFDHAFELARNGATSKLPEVHLKYALYLEDEEKFEQAESEFIKASKPREAIDMYIHQHDWESAVRVAEAADPSAVSDIYVAQAKVHLENEDYKRAESLFVSAGKPELALGAYQDANMWVDATRVAKRHLPHKLSDVNMAHQRSLSSSNSNQQNKADDILSAGKMWENSKQYSQAIDLYLSVKSDKNEMPQDELESIWQNAVSVAANHESSRFRSVSSEVAHRLLALRRYNSAAELFKEIDQFSDAVDCYIRAKSWSDAKRLCKEHAPELMARVDKARHANVLEEGTADERLSIGDAGSAIEMFISKGDWAKALGAAEAQGPTALAKYLGMRCKTLVDHGDAFGAVELVASYSSPSAEVESFFPVMEGMTVKTLGCSNTSHGSLAYVTAVQSLQKILSRFVKDLKKSRNTTVPGSTLRRFEQLNLVTHYVAILNKATDVKSLSNIATRIQMSLLRFIDFLPADKMFYLAGMACRTSKIMSPAFVFLNRYLDLSEAIEDGDSSMLDNSDFMNTDIPSPADFPLPKVQYIPDDADREDVRDWVLALSMDQQIQESLPERECTKCDAPLYDGTLSCPSCKDTVDACIVTGFPVSNKNRVSCTECDVVADRESWNLWTREFGSCAWCNAPQKMSY